MLNKPLLYALLISALPLAAHATEFRTIDRPRQECWNEQVPVQAQGYGGAIVGGVAGGIIGNQVGRGNGRTVATAIGAMTGAIVGDRISYNSGPSYQTVQRCRTVVDRVQVPVEYERPPVYYAQPPVIVESAPVIEQRVYYVPYGQPTYYQERWEHRPHRWHEHHHGRDD